MLGQLKLQGHRIPLIPHFILAHIIRRRPYQHVIFPMVLDVKNYKINIFYNLEKES